MKDIECPYCDCRLYINHDEGYGYNEDEVYQQECGECGKVFIYTTSVIYSHYPEKADCLNEGNHIWKPSSTYPKYFTIMICKTCDERRKPTDKERELHNIPKTYDCEK